MSDIDGAVEWKVPEEEVAIRSRIEVAMRHRIGGLELDVAFTLEAPWTVLFAPSGAGKTTILRVIAGLVRPDEGRVVSTIFPGSSMESSAVLTDTAAGLLVPAHRRVIRLLAQAPVLFPHLSVRDNVTYGIGRDPRDLEMWRKYVGEVMALCRIEHLAEKMPAALSGGERQRVALARTVGATGKRAVLLDEPFTGLDAALRDGLMRDVQVWLGAKKIPVLHVTHDVGEVFATGAEVIRLEVGRVVAQGTAESVLWGERERLLGLLGR